MVSSLLGSPGMFINILDLFTFLLLIEDGDYQKEFTKKKFKAVKQQRFETLRTWTDLFPSPQPLWFL